jgi:NTE family protein
MTRHGVVFGGGGVLGVAWEFGVLHGLADAGIDPVAGAQVVVGTSAGSVVGTRTSSGADLAALVEEQHDELDASHARSGEIMAKLDFQLLADLFVRWTGTWPMTEDDARACAELALKQSTVDEATYVGLLESTLVAEWTERDLRVVTVSCESGRRTAWSRADGVPLARAVAASCAIPGIMPPVTVDLDDGARHVDGGLWSGTNADLLVDDDLDAVLIVEPLSSSTNQLGASAGRSVDAEVAALEARGTTVRVISAGDAYGALSGDLLDPTKRPEAVRLGRFAGATAASIVAELLASGER